MLMLDVRRSSPHMRSVQTPFRITAPCPKQWESLTGGEQRRFCEHCQLHVHNLSAMSDDERERFISQTRGLVCIAYELRADGSMVTPTGSMWLLRPFQHFAWRAMTLLAAFLPFLLNACATRRTLGRVAISCDAHSPRPTESHHRIIVGRFPTPNIPPWEPK